MHRFYGTFTFDTPDIDLTRHEDLEHQLVSVLKIKKGDRIVLFNDQGEEAVCEVILATKKEVTLHIEDVQKRDLPTKRTHLFCAVLKKDNFELVVQKSTEVGVTDIHPIITERTVKQGLRYDRLERIAIEATEQSGRMLVPIVHEIEELEDAMTIAETLGGTVFFLDMLAPSMRLAAQETLGISSVFIGPEGGWSNSERKMFQEKANWNIVSLGDGVYRAETAAIVAGYLIANE